MTNPSAAIVSNDPNKNFNAIMSLMTTHHLTNQPAPFPVADHIAMFPTGAPFVGAKASLADESPPTPAQALENSEVALVAMNAAPLLPASDPLAAKLKAIQDACSGATQTATDDQKTGITTATTALQDAPSSDATAPSDFVTKMSAQRDAAIAASTATITSGYAAANNLGQNATPEQQNAIIMGMGVVGDAVNAIYCAITSFITDLIGHIMDIIKKIFDVVEQLAQTFAPIDEVLALF